MSLGDRKSTNSATSSFDDGPSSPPPSRHKADSGKGQHGIRVRFPSLNASNHSSGRKISFASRKSSMSSNDSMSTDHESTAEQKAGNDSGREIDDSASASVEEAASHKGASDSPVVIRAQRFTRAPSGSSSACSFGSVSGDELGIILSEEDEYNDTDDLENKTPSSVKKSPSLAKKTHITKAGSAVTPLSVQGKETAEMTKSFESDEESDDGIVASRDTKVEDPTSTGDRKMKAKKRRKKSKDKYPSKCLIQ